MRTFRFSKDYLILVATGIVWCATMFIRGLNTEMHPWELEWSVWVAAHDLMAGCFGYQLGQISMLSKRLDRSRNRW